MTNFLTIDALNLDLVCVLDTLLRAYTSGMPKLYGDSLAKPSINGRR